MLNDACKIISVDVDVFETARGDADSLAGLLLELKGRMPKQNEVIHYKNYSFKVLAIDSRRIKQIQVTLP
jgi:CBS domain containing-hemolysin-like protein